MIIEVKVPSPGESISEVQLAGWLVEDGAQVDQDQEIAEIDSDKATLTINASEGGRISLLAAKGDTIDVGAVIARIDTTVKGSPAKKVAPVPEKKDVTDKTKETSVAVTSPKDPEINVKPRPSLHLSPLAKKLLGAKGMSEAEFAGLIQNHRFSRKDIEFVLSTETSVGGDALPQAQGWGGGRDTVRQKMSTLRLKLSERLVAVKNETAMLTTFNEVNMGPVINIRNQYKDAFKEKHGLSLGFMSFFTRAVTEALSQFPQVNAQIDGDEIVYFKYADIGIAVSTPKGLMVPVVRNAETLSLAEIELKIKDLAIRARDGKISLEEMKGGTFTITNGGVFGSMLSTPILNPPQSAILGMHNIVERPVAVDGKVEIQPVMYLALSYDHRIIDGRESVTFLVKVKEMLEHPERMLFRGEDPVKKLLGL
jgi:2-oxoglutarate dehydrogenase E2 component (dihydrolipoamide succinyltransferase)